MQVDQLRAFHAVAEHRSFSRAADSLRVTQPAISKRVRALERRLGTALFDRIGRLVLLTEAGEKLLPDTRDILQRIADCETSIRNTSGHIEGPLAIATSHHVGLHRLPSVLRTFASAHPRVQLNLRFEDSEVAHELVRTGASELAVVTLDPLRGTTLAYLPLWDDMLRFVACRDHVLTSGTKTLADLCGHPAILPGFGTYTGRIIAAAFADAGLHAGLQATITMSTNYLETIRMLTSIGLGWSALPETMIDASLQTIDIHDAPVLTRQLGCVLHPTRTLSNAARTFVNDIMATAAL